MQGVNVITEAMERTLKAFPDLRKSAIEKATALAEKRVKAEISARLDDSRGMIASWQERRIGSKGGYGVVEATRRSVVGHNGKALPSSGDGSPGAITNYLESGHKIRSPKITGARGYRPRIKVASVNGRWFYKSAAQAVDQIVAEAIEGLCDDLARTLEGGGN